MRILMNVGLFFICAALLVSAVPMSAFATETVYTEDILPVSAQTGVVDENNSTLSDYEVEAASSGISYATTTGGTLVLDYDGEYHLLSNVIYTKIVYFSVEQVVFYQNAFYTEDTLDVIIDEAISLGIEVITPLIAAEIALTVGLPAGAAAFLVGKSLSLFASFLDKLDEWDLQDAISRSTTGRIKLECYYLQTVTYPFYQPIENFEPWNSNTVDVPDDYSHSWFENVYDYESIQCEHEFDQFRAGTNGVHGMVCGLCDCAIFVACRYKCTPYNTSKHKATCLDCGFSYYEAHNWNVGKNLCRSCGFDTEGSILLKFDGIGNDDLHTKQ